MFDGVDGGDNGCKRVADLHLAQCASNLSPNGVDVIVEGLEGKDLELWLFVREEAQDASCRDEAGHRVGSRGVRERRREG